MRTPNPLRSRTLLIAVAALLIAAPARAQEPAKKPAPPAAAAAPKDVNFEKEIAAYEASDRTAPPPAGGIEFIGSSSIKKWVTLKNDFPGLPVYNRGFGGSQAHHATMHAGRIVIPYKPKTIVFYSGDNDLNSGKTPEQVAADYAAFTAKVRAALPDVKFVILAVKPSVARVKLLEKQRQTNQLLQEWVAKDPGHLTYLDVFTPMLGPDGQPRPELYVKDNLHMSPAGYELWTKLLAPLLR